MLAAGFDKKLQLVFSEAYALGNVGSRDEVANQRRLFVDEMKARRAGLINLRHDCLVADAAHLHSGGHDYRDVRSRAIGGVIMKRKPARGVH